MSYSITPGMVTKWNAWEQLCRDAGLNLTGIDVGGDLTLTVTCGQSRSVKLVGADLETRSFLERLAVHFPKASEQ